MSDSIDLYSLRKNRICIQEKSSIKENLSSSNNLESIPPFLHPPSISFVPSRTKVNTNDPPISSHPLQKKKRRKKHKIENTRSSLTMTDNMCPASIIYNKKKNEKKTKCSMVYE